MARNSTVKGALPRTTSRQSDQIKNANPDLCESRRKRMATEPSYLSPGLHERNRPVSSAEIPQQRPPRTSGVRSEYALIIL
ncbi:hypothetical protein VI817_000148 [Penicillium citrinum]|nr:hypothetical protein VI817_000148 [Penicillium citrinum]